jgi:iron complex transport system ATP-binding protein
MTRLQIKGLEVSIHNLTLIHDFSWCGESGEIYALKGANGSGKTTLLKTLAGLISLKEERIFIDGKGLNTYSHQQRARLVSLLLQHSPEQHYCTGQSRIAHGLMPSLGYDFYLDECLQLLIKNMAERLRITHLLQKRLKNMSGGEQRLIHLARCLINPQPKILLLDEPSVFLDLEQQESLINNLKEEAECGRLIIFSSHDERFIERVATSVIQISQKQALVCHKSYSPPSSSGLLANINAIA